MAIEVRMRIPGATRWTISTFEEVLGQHRGWDKSQKVNIFVDTQEEADMFNGHALIFGSKNVAKIKPVVILDQHAPWVRAQIVEVSPLS